jgi:PAS domain-containing protein
VERVELTGIDGRDYEILSIPLQNREGLIDRAIEIVKDITDAKINESELRQAEQKYTNLFNVSGDGIIVEEIDRKDSKDHSKLMHNLSIPRCGGV